MSPEQIEALVDILADISSSVYDERSNLDDAVTTADQIMNKAEDLSGTIDSIGDNLAEIERRIDRLRAEIRDFEPDENLFERFTEVEEERDVAKAALRVILNIAAANLGITVLEPIQPPL